MEINRELKTTFGKISKLYDQARVSYPKSLIDDVIKFSKLNKGGKILDVGCGSGQATILFAELGYETIGLDISKELLDIAKEKCFNFSNVSFILDSFEDREFSEKFEIIFSGLAWHWIKPDKRYEKAHEILKDNGVFAVSWSFQEYEKSEFLEDVNKILDKYGGKGAGPSGPRMKDYANFAHEELNKSKLFGNVQIKEYLEKIEFSKERYANLILSYAWVQNLPKETKKKMMDELQEAFMKHEELQVIPYKYILILARKLIREA